MKKSIQLGFVLLLLVIPALLQLSGCISQEPAEINYHSDECTYCKMVISDSRFASQIVSEKGRSYPFDSMECMAAYSIHNPEMVDGSRFYVSDLTNAGNWLSLEEALLYESGEVQSPMGLSLFALPKDGQLPASVGVSRHMEWQEVLDYVTEQWGLEQ